MQAILEIALLKSFIAVIRLGSISAAALQVGRTQSALSAQMKRLEGVVGGELFYRSGSGVTPTRLGERLRVHAQSILSAHDDALSDISGSGLRGVISVGCPEDYLDLFIPKILTRFSAEHPKVEIEINCAPTAALKNLLHRRAIDVAILSDTLVNPEAEPLRSMSLVWVARETEPLILRSPTVPLALSAPDTLDHRLAIEAMRKAKIPYRIAFASNSLIGLLSVARSGQAISVVTEAAVPDDLVILQNQLPNLPKLGISLELSVEAVSEALSEFCRVATSIIRE